MGTATSGMLNVRYEFAAWLFEAPTETTENLLLRPKIFKPDVTWDCDLQTAGVIKAELREDDEQGWIIE